MVLLSSTSTLLNHIRNMASSKRKNAKVLKATHSNMEVDIDASLSFSHIPMHLAHQEKDEQDHKVRQSYSDEKMDKSLGLAGDHQSIALLTFLYVLQGIPLGLAGSVPYLLQSRSVSYKDQAIFSFVYWPFSIKLLWAPIVDSMYLPSFGRRKSWLVPIQYLIGLFMLALSTRVTELLGEGDNQTGVADVKLLTIIFFMLNFLAATQDIAVDGWALTMLSRRNVGWASTCNTVGQTAGYFLGNIVFLALESPDFCNYYMRSIPDTKGLLTLSGFLYFWGIVFLVTTTLVLIMKKENSSETVSVGSSTDEDDEGEPGLVDTYVLLWRIIKLPAVMSLISILLTVKMGFAAADSVTGLKLIEAGIPKEKLALIGVPMVPIQILLPIYISKYTAGPRPMDIFIKAMPYRLLMGLVFAGVVWWTPSTQLPDGSFPFYLYLTIIFVYALHQVALYCMFCSMMGIFAKVSDPTIGGTYMTLLNTISNFGGNWPSTVALWLVDSLTWKSCSGAEGVCDTEHDVDSSCAAAGGTCTITVDGYYVESVICIIIGFTWLIFMANKIRRLQERPRSDWSCSLTL